MYVLSPVKVRVAFTLFFLCVGSFCFSQIPEYWMQSAGGVSADEGYDIAVDLNSNVYTTGYFTNNANFDNASANTINLHSSGTRDIFICKNDTAGKYLWAIKAGGTNVDRGNGIKVDNNGNVYVTGYFSNTATFDGVQLTSHGFQDMFIAKYNTDGILQWVKSGGGSKNDAGNAVAVDNNGNVFVTGQFLDTAIFDSFSLISQIDSFTMNSSLDVFTLKYDSSGVIQWAKKGSSKYTDRGLDIGCDPQGNIFVTGQFSDTVLFEQVHNTTLYSAIFLIKYDANGNEIWFTKAGGGTRNIAYGLVVSDSGNVFLGGDFKGNVIFFGSTFTHLTTNFNEGVFVAKYNNDGDLLWAKSNGSDNEVSCRNIALDDSSNAYIIGGFKCIFSELSNAYGAGCFNSVGYNDIFISKFSSGGQWQWARNYGGQNDDYGRGICVNHFYQAIITGSYHTKIIIPWNNNFNFLWGGTSGGTSNSHTPNCNDSAKYNHQEISTGTSDIFIFNSLDPIIGPYYYYATIYDTLCVRPALGVGINGTPGNFNLGIDTVTFCGSGHIQASSFTGVGPLFNFLWSTGSTSASLTVDSTGMYSITMTSDDGCFVSSDSIFVIVHPLPERPKITDSKGININTDFPNHIHLCDPDSVTITVNNAGNDSIHWTGTGISHDSIFNFSSILLNNNSYSIGVNFIDSNSCQSQFTVVVIDVDSALLPVIPKLKFGHGLNDTATICEGDYLNLFLYDSITDPAGTNECNPVFQYSVINWSISLGALWNVLCNPNFIFSPASTGYYYINCQVLSNSPCGGSDSFLLSDSIYVIVNPNPIDSIFISGNSWLCPGDSITLYATTASNYGWSSIPGNLIHGDPHLSSVVIYDPGTFIVTVHDTNSFGCTTSAMGAFGVNAPPEPYISTNPPGGFICPGDSIEIISTSPVIDQWFGPAGPIVGTNSAAYATLPGEYYCIADSSGCGFVSNILEIGVYSTPYILVSSDVICPGSSVDIEIITNTGSNIQWQPPLSGSNLIQTISTPGTYSCEITSCGIVTSISVTLVASSVSASIDSSGPLTFCPGDSVTLFANPGMVMYEWLPDHTMSPFLVVYQPGNYSVITTDGYGCTAVSQVVTINLNNGFPPPVLSSNSPICSGESIMLSFISPGATNIQWTGPNGFSSNANSPVIPNATTLDSGLYSLSVIQGLCTNHSSTSVIIDTIPQIEISVDTPVCLNMPGRISASLVPNAAYTWTGPSGNIFTTPEYNFSPVLDTDTGDYHLQITLGNCMSNALFKLIAEECPIDTVIKIPNVITPDGDGYNDFFRIENDNIETINCQIFNRWGKLIFSWSTPAGYWNGTNESGTKVSEGVYFYIINIKLISKEPHFFKGTIQVLKSTSR